MYQPSQNVLAMAAQASQADSGRLRNQLTAQNALMQGVQTFAEAPARNALMEAQVGQAQAQVAESQHAMISRLLKGVERAPEHLRPQAWQHAYRQARQHSIPLEGVSEQFDAEQFEILSLVYAMPEAEVTEFEGLLQRILETEGPEAMQEALNIKLGRKPRAVARGLPAGYEPDGTGGMRPIRGGPQDPETIRGNADARRDPNSAPAGYRPTADGRGFEIIPGGPADPNVIREQSDARGASTNITIGGDGQQLPKPPAGTVWQMGNDGKAVLDNRGAPIAIPFQGGPAMADAAASETQAQGRRDQALREANVVTEDIGRAADIIRNSNWPTTGLFGAAMSGLPGSSAHDLNKMMDTIKSNSAFGALQKMRENSPTGGALGSVSERELGLLQSTIGSLEQSQGQQQVLDNLARVHNTYLDIVFGAGSGPQRMPIAFRQGDVQTRLDFLSAQYPNDPGKVRAILKSEGLIQ